MAKNKAKKEETNPVEEQEVKATEQAPEVQGPEEAKKEETKLPEGIEETFKARPDLKAAFVNGKQYFFNEKLAKQVLKQYDTIENPYNAK